MFYQFRLRLWDSNSTDFRATVGTIIIILENRHHWQLHSPVGFITPRLLGGTSNWMADKADGCLDFSCCKLPLVLCSQKFRRGQNRYNFTEGIFMRLFLERKVSLNIFHQNVVPNGHIGNKSQLRHVMACRERGIKPLLEQILTQYVWLYVLTSMFQEDNCLGQCYIIHVTILRAKHSTNRFLWNTSVWRFTQSLSWNGQYVQLYNRTEHVCPGY